MDLKRGWQTELAQRAGVDRAFLSKILSGEKRCPPMRARKLELASAQVLGVVITAIQWIERDHELFKEVDSAS